jgi:CheY-like chemotaxis protein
VLSRFKNDLAARHMPVQVIAADEDPAEGIKEGAMAFLTKPISGDELGQALAALRAVRSRVVKNLLVLCADESRCGALNELLAGPDVQLTMVKNAHESLAALRNGRFDCMVMELPGSESLAVLQVLERDMAWTRFPIVAHLHGDLTKKDEASLEHASQVLPVKAVKSMERLLDDTALHLHRVLSGMEPTKRSIIENLYQWTPVLADKKALVVDDDVRNIFAMTSLLENYRMKVISAESGADALELLGRNPDIDVVLMNIMMPKMDGYDAIRAIRRDERFKTLPIIAVTAKAMKGDREKCISAGASGYVTKPVDTHHLLSLMRQWILR